VQIPSSLSRWLTGRKLRVDARAMRRRPESRNPTLLCRDASRQRVFVKAAVQGDPGVAHEQLVLEALQAVPGAAVPRLLHASRDVLALEWVAGRTLWDVRRTGSVQPDAVIGETLAQVQIGGRAAVSKYVVRGDLAERLLWTSPELYASLGPAALGLFHQVQSSRTALATLSWLLEEETEARALLAHGDLRQPNIMVHRGQITFVDWELCGLGDPARDLGMLVAEDVRAWLLPRDEQEVQTRAQLEHHARELVSGWERAATKLGYVADQGHRTRVVGWTAEALLKAAFTVAHHDAHLPRTLVDAGVAMLEAPERWSRELLGDRPDRSPRAVSRGPVSA
jgi:hypothetical protein